MKKLSNLKYIILVFLMAGLFYSCDKDTTADPEFDTNPNQRLENQSTELRNLLISSEYGWKTTYFTDDPRFTDENQELGGWTFIFDFNEDNTVSMVSDFSEGTLSPNTSEYDIILGSTVKLSFTTKNYIHNLSDSNNAPTPSLRGQGYKGDFEFLYYGQEGEDIIFKTNREQIELRFQPATQEDWENISGNIETEGLLQSSGELELEINEGGDINIYDLAFSPATRFATNRDSTALSFGIAYNIDGGIKTIKPIPVGDQMVTDFVYDSENNWFISELENGDYAKIILGDPILISDVVNQYYFGALAASGHPINDSSEAFLEAFLDARDVIDQSTGDYLYGFFIVPNFNFIQYLIIDENGDLVQNQNGVRPNRIISGYSVDDATGTLILQDGGWNTVGQPYGEMLDPIHDILFNPQGLNVMPTGIFYNGDPVFYLISNEDPTVIIGTNGIEY